MRLICNYFFIGLLFCNIPFAQQSNGAGNAKQIAEGEWGDIVDYLNAGVAELALEEHKKKESNLNEIEVEGLTELSKVLEHNSIKEPVSFEELKDVLRSGWKKTLDNINTPIDSLKKSTPKLLDSLFARVERILVYRSSKIGQSPEYNELKDEIIQSQIKAQIDVPGTITELDQRAMVAQEPQEVGADQSFFGFWMISTTLLLISTLFFGIKWKNQRKKHKEYQLHGDKELHGRIRKLEHQLSVSDSIKFNLAQSLKESRPFEKTDGPVYPDADNKSPEVELRVPETVLEPIIIFAGKPTIENKFTNLSKIPIGNQTIFKLTLHEGGLQADFEVNLVDNYITRSVTNAPDEHLYRVCTQENSNKDFSREILTVKKGLAHLIDGYWTVKEENKATIKFQ